MKSQGSFFILAHEFSESPWNGSLFESSDEAYGVAKSSDHYGLLYIMKLQDFHWQLKNKRLSPRAIKATEYKGTYNEY